ncbi:IDEAL domain-containing protein [Bacillus sp. DJP31]|uniref:IDEAL domain-containing protein n=1 Tax=Bacillus sp. DJP31 TaxID=3409789 RepID=UPI003BB52BC9
MEKRRSYSDLMKASAMRKTSETEQTNIYVQMMLDEIIFNAKARRLGLEIDHALDTRDLLAFQQLSKEFNSLMRHA